ncbi:unnamed protein product [Phytophthora fragariaefolia]|uniref:Unnamed protein product n=1 Tax=Phytophthora fragariaefolia TaxID=1490495 RepID=A0A9W6XXG4_9STRA|nr:unnamed protein product [Phytophthora fragariaefolia]
MGGTGKMVQVAIGEVLGWYQENGTSADQIDTGTGRYRAIRSTSDPDPDRYGAIISSTMSNSASSVGTIISAHRVSPKWYIQELKSQRSGPRQEEAASDTERQGINTPKDTPADDSAQDSTTTYRQPTEVFPGGCPPNPKCRPLGPDQINSTSPRRSPEECNPRLPTGTQGEKTLSAPTDDRITPSVVGSLGHLCASLDRVSNFADPAPPHQL